MHAQQLIPVLATEALQEQTFKLTLSCPYIADRAEPGNFIHVRVSEGHYPLLRRAFSIHQVNQKDGRFEILFRVVGTGTEILSRARPGDSLDVLGPLGNSFSLPGEDHEIMLVAGGIGIAPLWFLLSRLAEKRKPAGLTFFLGARSQSQLFCLKNLRQTGVELVAATDDGSAGQKGLVTEVFLKELESRDVDFGKLAVCACGPPLMLRRMAEIAKRFDFSCQVSLENHMACGVGACWGCAVRQVDGTYKRVCADGPVFDARELSFE